MLQVVFYLAPLKNKIVGHFLVDTSIALIISFGLIPRGEVAELKVNLILGLLINTTYMLSRNVNHRTHLLVVCKTTCLPASSSILNSIKKKKNFPSVISGKWYLFILICTYRIFLCLYRIIGDLYFFLCEMPAPALSCLCCLTCSWDNLVSLVLCKILDD